MMEWSSVAIGIACSKMLLSVTVGAGLLAYYLLEAAKRPVVSCRSGGWRGFLETHVNILQERYWPTPWCYEARCQTIIASLIRGVLPEIPYTREVLVLKDGGQVSLDWLTIDQKSDTKNHKNSTHTQKKHHNINPTTTEQTDTAEETHRLAADEKIPMKNGNANWTNASGDFWRENGGMNTNCMKSRKEVEENERAKKEEEENERAKKEEKGNERAKKGEEEEEDERANSEESGLKELVLVLPGLTGSSQSEYVKGLVVSLRKAGLSLVVFNNRGIGGVRLMTTRTYCAANSDDLEEALDHLASKHPQANIFIIGISLGGMITGNYLATRGRKAASRVFAAAMVSAPWNMVDGLRGMERPGLNLLLNRYLASCLCELVESMSYQLAGDNHDWDYKQVMKSQTMREFDTSFTAKQFGFLDADDYYHASSLHTRMDNISVPVLSLTAADDPFQPMTVLPINAAAESSHVAMVVTSRGGHIGFMDGLLPSPSHAYYSDRLLTQLVTAVFSNMGEMQQVRREAEQYRADTYGPEQLLETSL